MTIDPESIVRRNPRVVFRPQRESGVVLDLDSGTYYELNSIGVLIWLSLGEGKRLEDLIRATRERIDDPPPDLEKDIHGFISSLIERDLVLIGDDDRQS